MLIRLISSCTISALVTSLCWCQEPPTQLVVPSETTTLAPASTRLWQSESNSNTGTSGLCDCVGSESPKPASKLDWILPRSHLPLPLMQELVEGRGVTLPLPLGTSIFWTEMNRHISVSEVRLGLGDNTPVAVNRVGVNETTFHSSTQIARVDLWMLPFLNIYGLIGHTRVTGDVDVTVSQFPFPGSDPVHLKIPTELHGATAGFGITAAAGTKDFFASLDLNKTWSRFQQLDSGLKALVITPRVGMIVDRPWFKGEIHVGAMWQDTTQEVNLTVNHPLLGDGLHVQVDQFEPRPWNFLVGCLWALDERLQFTVEGGFGGRSYIVSGITIRF
jgi:hypothetical protein